MISAPVKPHRRPPQILTVLAARSKREKVGARHHPEISTAAEFMARSLKPRSAASRPGKKPLTRKMLLPVPVAKARAISLETHLALAAMQSGRGNVDLMSCLLKVLYPSYFLDEALHGRREADAFRAAEAALERSATRAQHQQGWSLIEEDHVVLENIVALYDQHLSSVPAHLLAAAWDRLQCFVGSDRRSPIAVPLCLTPRSPGG